ncbi:MAG: hypothetical protein HT580_01840 [Dechloromonas sp.]|nr:MAG: hypothetical protein HT580_01840 [Dechloromonas sp.]
MRQTSMNIAIAALTFLISPLAAAQQLDIVQIMGSLFKPVMQPAGVPNLTREHCPTISQISDL